MKNTALAERPELAVVEEEPRWETADWDRFDHVLDVLARFELYLDECLEQSPGPLMDPWLDEALDLRVSSL